MRVAYRLAAESHTFGAAASGLDLVLASGKVPRAVEVEVKVGAEMLGGGGSVAAEAPQVLCRSYTGCGSRLRAA